jgi:hypothetical protein
MIRQPVAVGAVGDVATSSLFWRYAGQLHLTVALQARFSLEQDAAVARLPIGANDALRAAAGDAVPYRPACDVWLIGHCHGRPLTPTSPIITRLAVFRGAQALVEHQLRVTEGSDVGVAGYGPRRQSAMAELDSGGVLEIPRGFDWNLLQAAHPNQRVPFLHGDEMLFVEGLMPGRPRVRCRIPQARAVATLWPRGGKPNENGHALPLALDTLGVDCDSGTCVMVWRGYLPVDGEEVAPRLLIAAGLEGEGSGAIDWHEAWVLANAAAVVAAASTSGTLDLSFEPAPLTPAVSSRRPTSEETTLEVEETGDGTPEGRAPLPFRASPVSAPPPPPLPTPVRGRPRAATLETIETAPGPTRPATPFEKE